MIVDLIDQYTEQERQHLHDLRSQLLDYLSQRADHKKLVSFLAKAAVVSINTNEQVIYIGVPNEFLLTQVKKFFVKLLKQAVQEVYNPQFTIKFIVYAPLQKADHPLLINLRKLLQIHAKEQAHQQELQPAIKNELTHYFGILFEPHYTFDTFIAGDNNKLAYNAALSVAETPGQTHNPLFIYGNVGLGKTHLMQAIGNSIMKHFPDKVVLYLPASKLIDEIVTALRKTKIDNLIKRFDDVDVLLIDDIQFLANKETTQEIFHNIFNDFHSKKKQVILTSDRPPKELINIAPRLKSRFGSGLIADIGPANYETRLAIAHAKLQAKDEEVDDTHLAIIVNVVKDNIRELEGAINTLMTRKKLLGRDLEEDDVHKCLESLGYSLEPAQRAPATASMQTNNRSKQNFSQLVEMVASYYNLSIADIK